MIETSKNFNSEYLKHMSKYDMLDNINFVRDDIDLEDLVNYITALQKNGDPIKMIRGIMGFHKVFKNKALIEGYGLACKLTRLGEFSDAELREHFPKQMRAILNEDAKKIATNLLTKTRSKQNAFTHKQLILKIVKADGIPIYTEWPLKRVKDELIAIIPSQDKVLTAFSGPDKKSRDVVFLQRDKAVVCELKYFPTEASGGNQDKSFKDIQEIHEKSWFTGEYFCTGLGICDGVHHLTQETSANYKLARKFESSMTFLPRVKDLLK